MWNVAVQVSAPAMSSEDHVHSLGEMHAFAERLMRYQASRQTPPEELVVEIRRCVERSDAFCATLKRRQAAKFYKLMVLLGDLSARARLFDALRDVSGEDQDRERVDMSKIVALWDKHLS